MSHFLNNTSTHGGIEEIITTLYKPNKVAKEQYRIYEDSKFRYIMEQQKTLNRRNCSK